MIIQDQLPLRIICHIVDVCQRITEIIKGLLEIVSFSKAIGFQIDNVCVVENDDSCGSVNESRASKQRSRLWCDQGFKQKRKQKGDHISFLPSSFVSFSCHVMSCHDCRRCQSSKRKKRGVKGGKTNVVTTAGSFASLTALVVHALGSRSKM